MACVHVHVIVDLTRVTCHACEQAREKVLKDFNKTQLEDIEKFGALFPHLNVSYRIKVSRDAVCRSRVVSWPCSVLGKR